MIFILTWRPLTSWETLIVDPDVFPQNVTPIPFERDAQVFVPSYFTSCYRRRAMMADLSGCADHILCLFDPPESGLRSWCGGGIILRAFRVQHRSAWTEAAISLVDDRGLGWCLLQSTSANSSSLVLFRSRFFKLALILSLSHWGTNALTLISPASYPSCASQLILNS
jgi:hypothetical protein